MRRSWLLGLAATTVVAAASIAAADVVRWSLKLEHGAPEWVRISAGTDGTRVAWYMSYSLSNASGAARKPMVRVELRTDTDKVYGDNGDARVVAAVKKATGDKSLVTAFDVARGIGDGDTVKCVASFGEVDNMAHAAELRVYGLMDAIDTVAGKKYREVRYWRVKYQRKGDEFRRTEDKWKAVESGWVVESREELPEKEK